MELNEKWHNENVMPKNPTMEQRVKWHMEHAKNCGCREMPKSVQEEIAKGMV